MADDEMTGGGGLKAVYKCELSQQQLRGMAEILSNFGFLEDGSEGLLPGEAPPKPYLLATVQLTNVANSEPVDTLKRGDVYKHIIGEMPHLDRHLDEGRTDQLRIKTKEQLDKLLKLSGQTVQINTKDAKGVVSSSCTYYIKASSVERRNNAKGTVYNPPFNEHSETALTQFMAKAGVIKVEAITKRGKTIEDRIPTGVYILTFNSNKLPKDICAGYYHLEVREYFDNPMQCNKCLQLNHTRKWCKNDEVCFSCGVTGHKGDTCNVTRCVNCLGEDHVSKDRRCGMYQFEKRLNIYAQRTNHTKGAARHYAYATACRYIDMISNNEMKVTYSSQLKAFENRLAVPVPTSPSRDKERRIKSPAYQPKDVDGNAIKSIDDVHTNTYIESLFLNMKMPRQRRIPIKSTFVQQLKPHTVTSVSIPAPADPSTSGESKKEPVGPKKKGRKRKNKKTRSNENSDNEASDSEENPNKLHCTEDAPAHSSSDENAEYIGGYKL